MKTVFVIQFHDERYPESELEKFAFTSLDGAFEEVEKYGFEYQYRYNEYYNFTHKSDNRESATIIELEVI